MWWFSGRRIGVLRAGFFSGRKKISRKLFHGFSLKIFLFFKFYRKQYFSGKFKKKFPERFLKFSGNFLFRENNFPDREKFPEKIRKINFEKKLQ